VDQAWERIGVTGNHPIWPEDRHGYVAAMDLRVGERLKNLSGDTVWVQQKLPRPGPTPVYNLEVQDEHVYYVGASGVLAHNSTDCDAPNKGLPVLTPHFTPKPTTKGRVGEVLSGLTGDKTKILINGRNRIPDGLTGTTLTEVKNVANLSYTRQLRDFADYARANNLSFELFVPQNTARFGLSGPLRDAIKRGDIVLKTIPGM
jgi:hypothetical protein